ncbi:MAG: hypothetical protein EOO32_02800 [Comamonadaceae bacterium]|nr:MAG: hypothetical protein EOO32_02800 [Comamonadaceae bacterium]
MRMYCPHCESTARLHSVIAKGLLWREVIYCCTDVYCGHNFVARAEVQRTLCPSKTPNPSVSIPISARATKRRENKAKREAAAAACATAAASGKVVSPTTQPGASPTPVPATETHAPTAPPGPVLQGPRRPAAPHSQGTPWPAWLVTSR